MSDNSSQVLIYTLLKSAKNDSSFIYFTLEANEGIAFYSTLEHSEGDLERIIECFTPVELKEEFTKILESLEKFIEFEIIEQKELIDSL